MVLCGEINEVLTADDAECDASAYRDILIPLIVFCNVVACFCGKEVCVPEAGYLAGIIKADYPVLDSFFSCVFNGHIGTEAAVPDTVQLKCCTVAVTLVYRFSYDVLLAVSINIC